MKRMIAVLSFLVLTISVASAQRLPEMARPTNYKLLFNPDLENAKFEGEETITLQVLKPTSEITLNAVDIDFHDVTITSGGATQKAKVSAEKEKEMVVLAVPKPLAAGTATVHVTYTGILNSEMRGFYLGKDDQGRKYAATQFEATDARRAFPSFDEPDYKATFDISVVSDKGLAAISNQKVASDTPGPGDKHTVRFATTAKMSAYLAALVVGNFEYVEGEADGIPIRVYATTGKKEMGRFALEIAGDIMKYYDKYFGIKYPYAKLDLVGLPDFSAGAMENTGCITFREVILLIDEKQGSVDLKKNIAGVISHEMAHQWFGDLVTMKWWDDVWLNEGFATWMSSKPIESFKADWNFNLDDVSGTGADSQCRLTGEHASDSSGRGNPGANSGVVRRHRLWQGRVRVADAGGVPGRRHVSRRRQCLSEAASVRKCHSRRFLGRSGEDLEEARRQDHADVGEAGGSADHQREVAVFGQLDERHVVAAEILF